MNGYGNEDGPPAMHMQQRTIACAYMLGQIVYHRIVPEKRAGMVTGIDIDPAGIIYRVTWPDLSERPHYECELTTEFVPDYEPNG